MLNVLTNPKQSNQSVKKHPCEGCGSTEWTMYFGTACDQCDCPKPKSGEESLYCKEGMHFHCYATFDGCDGCQCHEDHFNMFPIQKSYMKEHNITRYDHLTKRREGKVK